MFGIGPFEMLIIAAVALMVIGPEKFPEFAKIVFRTITDFKQYINETKRDIEREMRPMQKELRELAKYKPEDYIDKLSGGAKTTPANGAPKTEDASAADSAQSAPVNTHPYDTAAAEQDAEAIKSGLESEEAGGYNPEPEAPAAEENGHPADRAGYEEDRDRNAGKSAPEHPLPERLDG